ncbi:hypothetical protein Ocin01_05860, partial [Orchesella cincta]
MLILIRGVHQIKRMILFLKCYVRA